MGRLIRSTRSTALLAIALLLTAVLGARLHEALVPHAICAEHGEPIEVSPGALREAAHRPHESGPRVEAAGEAEDAHEHCEIALLESAKGLSAALPAPGAPAIVALRAAESWPVARAETSVPLVLLAPKHSPPRVA